MCVCSPALSLSPERANLLAPRAETLLVCPLWVEPDEGRLLDFASDDDSKLPQPSERVLECKRRDRLEIGEVSLLSEGTEKKSSALRPALSDVEVDVQTDLPVETLAHSLSRLEELCLPHPAHVPVCLLSTVDGEEPDDSDGREPVSLDERTKQEEIEVVSLSSVRDLGCRESDRV